MKKFTFPSDIMDLIYQIEDAGGRVCLVGGMVRDYYIGIENAKPDYDFEVFWLNEKELSDILQINMVGKTGVFSLIVNGHDAQFSIPRSDVKVINENSTKAYSDFTFAIDPYMSIYEAPKRRDFTMNAIYYDVAYDAIIDPFGGIDDIAEGIIVPVSDDTFADDSVRILRAARFANRFDMLWSPKLIDLAKSCVHELANQTLARIKIELVKMLKTSTCAIGFAYLADIGAFDYILKFFKPMMDCANDNPHHLESDVFVHSLMVFEALCRDKAHGTDVKDYTMLAALLHDIGKPIVKEYNVEKGYCTYYGHEGIGEDMAKSAILDIDNDFDNEFLNNVPLLTKYHMEKFNRRFYMRLLRKHGKEFVCQQILLNMADVVGATKQPELIREQLDNISSLFDEYNYFTAYTEFIPIVTGKRLIEMGYTPTKKFGIVLDKLAEMQIDDELPSGIDLAILIKRLFES